MKFVKYSPMVLALVVASVISSRHSPNPLSKNLADDTYEIQDNLTIKTRSGVPLSAIVATKKGNQLRLPAILFYTTYDRGARDNSIAKLAVDKGYVGVVAYARGIRNNLNDYTPYEHEGNDIYDVIDWISKQSWCNGQVGMYGGSYTGFSQWAAVKRIHPALKTIVPQVAVMPGYDTPMENGVCPSALCLRWPNDILKYDPLPQDIYSRWYAKGISYRSLDRLAGHPNRIFQKWLQHPAYDAYWKSLIPTANEFARINIPILSTTGYYDPAQIGALRYVKLHYKYNPHAGHYLVIGPYDHFGGQRSFAANLMGYEIDAVAKVNMQDLAFEWFDYVLKNGNKPELLKDKINYEVMGANEWAHGSSLETISNKKLTLYLSDRVEGANHLLSAERPAKLNFLSETVDLKDRVNQNNFYTTSIINDSFDGGDALVFVTKVFDRPFRINGSFSGQLSAAINKRDMDISALFFELTPEGKYFYLTRYLGRASYAHSISRRILLSPGKKTVIPLADARMISRQISKGSRLVVAIHINKNPFEVINYGSGKNVYDETIDDAKEPLRVKWYNDSYIKVPIFE